MRLRSSFIALSLALTSLTATANIAVQHKVKKSHASHPATVKSAIVKPDNTPLMLAMDAVTHEILSGEDVKDKPCDPASLVKSLGNYAIFSALKRGDIALDDKVTLSPFAANQERSLGLKAGTQQTVEKFIEAANIYSANDAEVALAEHIAGSEANFVAILNETAKSLGMKKTLVRTASGLPVMEKGKKSLHQSTTTPGDMALLAAALPRDFPEYMPLLARRSFTYHGDILPGHTAALERNNCKAQAIKAQSKAVTCAGHDVISNLVELQKQGISIPLVKTGYVKDLFDRKIYNMMALGKERGRAIVFIFMRHPTVEARTKAALHMMRDKFSEPVRPVTTPEAQLGSVNASVGPGI